MKTLRYISMLVCIFGFMQLSSCDVHEFPTTPIDPEVPFVLHLNYDTNMPQYKIVGYNVETRAEGAENYDFRYIVKVYGADQTLSSESEELYHFVFTKDDIENPNNSVTMKLPQGEYNFMVWSDYVLAGSDTDYLYNAQSFKNISLVGDVHQGSNDYRDAFSGAILAEVSLNNNEATVDMKRPVAKFNFIATDIVKFVSLLEDKNGKSSEDGSQTSVNLEDFKVIFRYDGFMPNVFNLYSDEPSDAVTGVSFESRITRLNDNEVELGFDYLFANYTESIVKVSVEVYGPDNKLLSRINPVAVPVVRGKLTTVKGYLLTSSASDGVTIVPDFDGDYNYIVE